MKSKLWFSLYDNKEYQGHEPSYWDITSFKGIKELIENTEIIYQEFLQFIQKQKMESHFNITMVEKPNTWKVRSLRVWSVEMYQYQKFFPKTMQLLSNIDNVINVGFNLLEPHSKIKEHQGDTNAIIRCHLPLEVPQENEKCFLVVKNEKKHWKKGEVLAFTDAYTHYAENSTNERRIILLFDILRPEFAHQKYAISATVLTSFYLQQLGNYFPSLYQIPRKQFKYLLYPFVKLIQIAIPIRNFLKKQLK